MALILGHELPANGNANFDNNPLNKIIYNGVTVWERIVFTTKEFEYTGNMQSVVVPPGLYLLEVWGAQGGDSYLWTNTDDTYKIGSGGYGGYSGFYRHFSSETTLYVCVGGRGEDNNHIAHLDGSNWGGYNGGGHSRSNASGGGATHIATASGLLAALSDNRGAVLVVAGGGGGAGYSDSTVSGANDGGSGGGLRGNDGAPYHYTATSIARYFGTGGTQSSAGYFYREGLSSLHVGSFGKGGGVLYTEETDGDVRNHGWTGGGGGWYGGGGAGNWNSGRAAGGGSGYIGVAHLDGGYYTTHNNVKYEHVTTTGQRAGNGFARITRITD